MGFMSDEERTFSRAVSELALANPFLPERIVAEKKALGDAFIETGPVWHAGPAARVEWFPRFAREVRQHFELPALAPAAPPDPAQLIAFFFQVRRAFHFTMQNILGGSLPAARLRAAVWQ